MADVTIYTTKLPATANDSARIKASAPGLGVMIFPYPFAANDPHAVVAAKFAAAHKIARFSHRVK